MTETADFDCDPRYFCEMANTLWNERDRRALDDRLVRLTPDARGLWGSFDAPRMLCHITDAVRTATGDVQCAAQAEPACATRRSTRW